MNERKNEFMIRQATKKDVSRIAEMIVINYRVNFYPFFKNDSFYFDELNVIDMASKYESEQVLESTYVYDDGVVKGMIYTKGNELVKLYIEPQFQCNGIGSALLHFAIEDLNITWLWALEYNKRGIAFYRTNGFKLTSEKMMEDDWIPLVKLKIETK